jgi:predicted nucleic acid-binding protein
MNRYLLDTNHLGEAVGRISIVRDRIQQQSRKGTVFGTCGPVLCELFVGILKRKDAKATRRRLDGLLQLVRVWPVEIETALHYGEIYRELQKAGRVLSQVDMILASLCRQQSRLTLLTADADFQALPDVSCENWLAKKSP